MTIRKPRAKKPTTLKPIPEDTRRAVVQECLDVILVRERALLVESDQAFFHAKLDARIEELALVKKEILKLLPVGE